MLGIAILSGLLFRGVGILDAAYTTLLMNLSTWPLYEMSLNWVNWGTLFPNKGNFVIGPVKFHHPPPYLIMFMAPVGWTLLLMHF